jgi:predicted lipoprotein with Yx(FWY)xxD motif
MAVGPITTLQRTVAVAVAAVLVVLSLASTLGASAVAAAPTGTEVSALSTATYGSVLVVGDGRLAGYPLYSVSSDAGGKFGCTIKPALGYDFSAGVSVQVPCTGPEDDALCFDDCPIAFWPALTTTAAPVAGAGVHQDLLGTVHRPGIGDQVTYAGRPLYLFDGPSHPFVPLGEGSLGTVAPLPPWHGLWDLVSAANGQPAPGVATVETEALPHGRTVVAAEEYPTTSRTAVIVYSFSGDRSGVTGCTAACAVTWIPVLTTGLPSVAGAIAAKDVGVVRRPDGTMQVTYDNKPLYLYSAEQASFGHVAGPPHLVTAGNGNGRRGPGGGVFSVVSLVSS